MSMPFGIINVENGAGGVVILLMKICRVCGKASYSASEHRLWPCPYCNTDLSEGKTMNANGSKPTPSKSQCTGSLGLKNK